MLSVGDRLRELFRHLGIERAHVAARMQRDWDEIVGAYPTMVASLTLIAPGTVAPTMVGELAARLLVVTDDKGPFAERVRGGVAQIPSARLTTLNDYSALPWTDMVAERAGDIARAMMTFLAEHDSPGASTFASAVAPEGEIAGISYRIRGGGPPLILFPLFLSPSQWEPIIPALGERYATIVLGGAFLGPVALLESRARAGGYRRLLRTLIDEVELRPAETVLEVGSGTGAVARWLATHTQQRNPIVGVDINHYLLREATTLAANEGLAAIVAFREGRAEALPFPDASFDVTISVTVIEEVDADRLLAEMVRVTKPGGRVAVIARSIDLPFMMNIALASELKTKVERPGLVSSVVPHGCADASLYQRFRRVGLTPRAMYPSAATFDTSEPEWLRFMDGVVVAGLSGEEVSHWRAARARAEEDGTFFMAFPHHCAVGTKP